MTFDQGAAAPRRLLTFDSTGVAANVTLMVYTVTQPDGTPVVTNPVTPFAVGDYRVNGPTAQPGRHLESWVGTGTNATAKPDQYDVRSNVSAALLSLSDAKAALNIPATDYTNDDEIRDKLDTVTDLIEGIVGYIVPRAVTATVILSGSAFFLPGPVISVTSITPVLTNGWAYTAADFTVQTSGLVSRLDGSRLSGQAYTVVYQAGRAGGVVEARFLEAARVLIEHLWRVQRGSGVRPGQGSTDDEAYTPPMIPPRVYEILQRDRIVSVA